MNILTKAGGLRKLEAFVFNKINLFQKTAYAGGLGFLSFGLLACPSLRYGTSGTAVELATGTLTVTNGARSQQYAFDMSAPIAEVNAAVATTLVDVQLTGEQNKSYQFRVPNFQNAAIRRDFPSEFLQVVSGAPSGYAFRFGRGAANGVPSGLSLDFDLSKYDSQRNNLLAVRHATGTLSSSPVQNAREARTAGLRSWVQVYFGRDAQGNAQAIYQSYEHVYSASKGAGATKTDISTQLLPISARNHALAPTRSVRASFQVDNDIWEQSAMAVGFHQGDSSTRQVTYHEILNHILMAMATSEARFETQVR